MGGDDGNDDQRDATAGNAAHRVFVDDDFIRPCNSRGKPRTHTGQRNDFIIAQILGCRDKEGSHFALRIAGFNDVTNERVVLLLRQCATLDLVRQRRAAFRRRRAPNSYLRPFRNTQLGKGFTGQSNATRTQHVRQIDNLDAGPDARGPRH